MPETITPIKIRIGLRLNGHADHPDWTQVPLTGLGPQLWGDGTSPDHYCLGSWHYDKVSGHAESNGGDSPIGMQWGMRLVTPDFGLAAVARFPTIISVMTEAEAKTFYNVNCRGHMPDNRTDQLVMDNLSTELALRRSLTQNTTALESRVARALDPLDREPGVIKDPIRYWDDCKLACNFVVG